MLPLIASIVGVLLLFAVAQVLYLAIVMAWTDQRTRDLGYYGMSRDERSRFRRKLRAHAILLSPVLWALGRWRKFSFEDASFQFESVSAPRDMCSEETFQGAVDYEPGAEDIFVVTQMKCGTTWMQHLVYEMLHRGRGDLVEAGSALGAVSPWIESRRGVPMESAPLIGRERPSRVIKSHLPAALCPFSPHARYIYVVRHPLSCFASCVDFMRTNLGGFAPPLAEAEKWFRSEELMWWGTWPRHVLGWAEWSETRPNVLFVAFEDMKRDLVGEVRRIADFLDLAPLQEDELGQISRKCGFDYMKTHGDAFEMHPPHILQSRAKVFVSGRTDRFEDVPAEVSKRLLTWCRHEVAQGSFPLGNYYEDLQPSSE